MVGEITENNELSIGLATPPPEVLLTPNIGVIGVGGAGGNAINNMVQSNVCGVSFFAANTDAHALSRSLVADKIQLGASITKGLGAGANPEVGRAAAEESADKIKEVLSGLHLLFLTAGMGGGTGTGAAPVVAKIAKEMNILTVGVVSKPFNFEGSRRMKTAEAGIAALQKYVDALVVIPNQNLYRIAGEKMTFMQGFKLADNVLCQGVRGITDLIMKPGIVNLDFADVRTVLSTMGRLMMGTGEASGENRALEAAEQAITNPLLDNTSIKGAKSLLVNVSGGMDLTMTEYDTAMQRIRAEVDPDANIIFGTSLDEDLAGKMRVSLVATGIEDGMSAEGTKVPEPVVPVAHPISVQPTITTPQIQLTVPPVASPEPISEPELITTPPVRQMPTDLIAPEITITTPPDDLVVDLDHTPVMPDPVLFQEEAPVMPEPVVIQDIPEARPNMIPMEAGTENVKPQQGSILESFSRLLGKRRPMKTPPKKDHREPSLLDELEADMDLPPFLTEPRK